MSEALVERLRHGAEHLNEGDTGWPGAYKEAADRIEALERRVSDHVMASGVLHAEWLREKARAEALERENAELLEEGRKANKLADQRNRDLIAAEADKARLSEALRTLLDCPDIADNDDKDEETHAAERVARAALSGSGSGWRECATEGCAHAATVRFERGGVGSEYCHACYMRIQALPAAPQQGGE